MMTKEDFAKFRAMGLTAEVRLLCEIAENTSVIRMRAELPGAVLCPACGSPNSKVIETRNGSRRRECAMCTGQFDTVEEMIERVDVRKPTALQLAKSEGERQRKGHKKDLIKAEAGESYGQT